jgi:DNA primase
LITRETIQEIQSRIDIVDVITGFVKLKKRGSYYLGNCPFHHEKTPSFTVTPSKEIFKCFGCGKSGNAIGFLMDHEKYSYVETLHWLAARYNISIEETESTPEQKAFFQASDSLFAINHFARDFFSNQLYENELGTDIALPYLQERGFRNEIIEKFQIGYDPDQRDLFANAALKNQYQQDWLLKTGLVVQRDGQLIDNYRGRIIFPIHNQSGKVVGFGARVIKTNDKSPKYINTPENELYSKSKILYGLYFAKTAIDRLDECLLVEGYTDVVSLNQAGIENVVASGGTALTVDQLRLIKKFTKNLTILYDGDGAGVKAALRGLDLAIEEGLQVRLALIPDNEDPDSYVRKLGAESFRDFIQKEKKDFILFQLGVALREPNPDSNHKAKLVQQMAETISKLNKSEEFTRRQDYIKQVAEMLKIEEDGLNALVNKFIREKIQKEQQKIARDQPEMPDSEPFPDLELTEIGQLTQPDEPHEKALIGSLLEFGNKPWDDHQNVAAFIITQVTELGLDQQFSSPLLQKIYLLYCEMHLSGLNTDSKEFLYHEDQEVSKIAVDLLQEPEQISPNWSRKYEGKILSREDLYREEISSVLIYLQLRKIKKLIVENQQELSQTNDPEAQLLMLQTHQALKSMETSLTEQIGTVIYK